MIILDTNIISEMMRQTPSQKVVNWLDQQDSALLYVTSITIAEISYGIHALSLGNRRSSLENAFNNLMNAAFKHRVFSFDETANTVNLWVYEKI
jgi:predicted nucleic acid-binding protein